MMDTNSTNLKTMVDIIFNDIYSVLEIEEE